MRVLLVALALTLIAVFLEVVFSGSGALNERYDRFCRWDCVAYRHIAQEGYPQTLDLKTGHSLAAFFPGHPIMAKLVHLVLRVPFKESTTVASQLATLGFWIYLLLILKRRRISTVFQGWCCALILFYPAFFFFVSGYTEAFFMMNVLGFLFWLDTGIAKKRSVVLICLHGIALTATRFVGLPLVLIPILSPQSFNAGELKKRLMLAAISSLGGLSFFLFSQLRYGKWNAYLLLQSTGWKNQPHYLGIFDPTLYRLFIPSISDNAAFHFLSYALVSYFFLILASIDFLNKKETLSQKIKERGPFYLCAFMLLYLSVSGVYSSDLNGMLRYNLCVFILLVLGAVDLISKIRDFQKVEKVFWSGCIGLLIVFMFFLEIYCMKQFTSGQWVADLNLHFFKSHWRG